MFDKAGEENKPLNASLADIRGAFIDNPLGFEDRDVTFANGKVCKLRIMKPGPADYNWWQSQLVEAAVGKDARFPPECYPDIIIRCVYNPETNAPVFNESHRPYLLRSAEKAIIHISEEWIREITKLRPTIALKNSGIPEEEN